MSRSLAIVALVASTASAQPPPPPPVAAAPSPTLADDPYVRLTAGLGVARYREKAPGLVFEADLEPYAQVAAQAGLAVGRGELQLHAAAGFGIEVHMDAVQNGSVVQQNKFRQEVYEAGPRLAWPINANIHVAIGYRLTYQRIFILDVPMIGSAQENVTVHAIEVGGGWQRTHSDGSALNVDLRFGLNHGSADNDRIEGEDFGAGGHAIALEVRKRWAAGFTAGGAFTTRTQNGSDQETVTFDGMPVTAFWPDNTTWQLMFLAGFVL